MGGAFDPIHMAHLVTAEEALVQFDLDQVLFMPAGDPPHKGRAAGAGGVPLPAGIGGHGLASRGSRSRASRSTAGGRATRSTPWSTWQASCRRAPSCSSSPGPTRCWTSSPGRTRRACSSCPPSSPPPGRVTTCPSCPGCSATLRAQTVGLAPEARVKTMEVPALAISSSMIRERLAAGKGVRYLVPEPVAEFIEKSGLYAADRWGRVSPKGARYLSEAPEPTSSRSADRAPGGVGLPLPPGTRRRAKRAVRRREVSARMWRGHRSRWRRCSADHHQSC